MKLLNKDFKKTNLYIILLSFFIGSFVLVSFSHWIGFYGLYLKKIAYIEKSEKEKFNIFGFYVILSATFYGLINVLITYLRMTYNFNIHYIYLIFSVISGLAVTLHNLYLKILWDSYTFKTNLDKLLYFLRNFTKHFVSYNFIIKGLEIYLN